MEIEQHQFDSILGQLIMIERNIRRLTEKRDKVSKLDLVAAEEVIIRVQDLFFSKLQLKTGWGRNEIKQLFEASVEQIRAIKESTKKPTKDLPWQQ